MIAKLTSIINSRGRNEDTKLISYWKSPGVAGPGGTIHRYRDQHVDRLAHP